MTTNATDTFEIPAGVQESLDAQGQITSLKNTLMKIWFGQATQALDVLNTSTTPGFGFSISAAQRWGMDRTQDVKDYTKSYIQTSRAFWELVVAASAENPDSLKIPTEGLDGEVNKDVYVNLVNDWMRLAYRIQQEWTIAEGMPKAYGIQDAMEAFIGSEGLVRQVGLVPGFDGSDVVLWTPEADGE